jgi:signal transduction histidine kinase
VNPPADREALDPAMPGPVLSQELVGRAFPFFLWLDPTLHVRAAGVSLRKAWPAVQAGAPLHALFDIRRPGQNADIDAWRRHGTDLCTLKARGELALSLRGNPECLADGSLLLLVTPVITSLEQLRGLGLGFNDFAKHDAAGEMLLLARTSQMSAQDTSRLAERLKTRSAELHMILELSHSGVLACRADGHLQHANSAVLGMLGLGREQVIGMSCQQVWDHVSTLLDPSGPPPDWREVAVRELQFTLHLAVPRPAVIVVDTRPNASGGWITYWRDITAESEVDRMKSEFLSTAAHELRTPMVSIFGFTELLLSRDMPAERRQDVLSTIHRQSSLLIKMVNELLDLARIEARQGKDLLRVPVRLGALVVQCIQAMQGTHAGHRLSYQDASDAPELLLDLDKTSQAVTNILSNAVKYSPDGSTVHVSLVHRSQPGRTALGVQVADQGMGMTSEQTARAFERFYRADPSGNIPGTGLGMSLVKEIVHLQGGDVEIHSEIGRGTVVTLWFPLPATALRT